MTIYYLAKGGPCIPECLPICDGCRSSDMSEHLPFPGKIAGEYNRGNFTLGQSLNPAVNQRQRTALGCVAAAVGDFIPLLLVPELHTIDDVFVEVQTDQTIYVPNVHVLSNNMAGLTFDVEARIYDANGVQTGTIALGAPLTGVAGNVDSAVRVAVSPAAGGEFVPTGSYVLIGPVLTGLPATAGVTMDKISGQIAVVTHVRDYQYPLHV